MTRTAVSSGQAWDTWYGRHGRRVIATRHWRDDAQFRASGQHDLQYLLNSFGVPAGGSVHEIGCGPGRLTVQLATVYDHITANDVSSLALADCARHLADDARPDSATGGPAAGPQTQLLHGGADSLHSLPAGAYDAVLSIVTLQHISDRDEVVEYFRQSVRLLRPGGVALLQLARATSLRACHDVVADWGRRLSGMPRGRHWRGCTLGDPEILGLAAELGVSASLRHDRWMTWVRLQA